jgi:hypothetical protein
MRPPPLQFHHPPLRPSCRSVDEKKRNDGEERMEKWTGLELGMKLMRRNGKVEVKSGSVEVELRGEWNGGGEGEPLGNAELP